MRTRTLIDEVPSSQDLQCQQLGAEYFNTEPDDEEDAPSYGADPFDILAHKQSQGETQ
jgi:hypothetical protein